MPKRQIAARRSLFFFLCCSFFQCPGVNAAPPARYRVTDLGTIPGGSYPAVAFNINNRGQITGQAVSSNLQYRPFFYHDVMHEIAAGTNGGFAGPLNDSGQALGTFDTDYDPLTKGRDHAFLYSGGTVTDLSVAHGAYIRGTGINSVGQFVGYAEAIDGSLAPFIYSGGSIRLLNFGIEATLADINDAGEMLGIGAYPGRDPSNPAIHATIFGQNTYRDLGVPRGSVESYGLALNNRGEAVGYSALPNQNAHGFIYAKGRMVDVGTLPGDVSSRLWNINEDGVAVGTSEAADETGRAVLWEHHQLRDLNDLIPADSGWLLISANGINDHGQIVGAGLLNGEYHPFLLTPIR